MSKQISDLKQKNAEQNALLTAKDAEIADLLARNAELTAQLGKKNV